MQGLRALVVEDEALVSMMVEEFLDELGYKVVATAASLDEAIAKAGSAGIDVAILDVNLAGEMSYPVAEILLSRGIPFIFATGYGIEGRPAGLEDAPLISKPFRLEQLGSALTMAFRR
jgi:CheY-like chemotaxis protein